jgi:hypothetical protein
MQISVSTSAPYGTYTFTVTASDCCGQVKTASYTLNIIAPSITTIGYSTSAYAVTFPSQSALFFANNQWFVFYSDGTNLVTRTSTDNTGQTWGSSYLLVPGVNQGYSFAVQIDGNNVYFAYIPASFSNSYTFGTGTVSPTCPLTGDICWNTPFATVPVYLPPGITTMFAAGAPTLTIDTNSTAGCGVTHCVWVTVPTVDNKLMWHVQISRYPAPWTANVIDVPINVFYTGTSSDAHAQVVNMPGGIAFLFATGNYPAYPRITVIDHVSFAKTTYCPIAVGSCVGPGSAAGWTTPELKFYEQQSQMVNAGDTIYFTGLARVGGVSGASVYFFEFTYNGPSHVGVCGLAGCFSNPSAVPVISSITNFQLVNHSWHMTVTWLPNAHSLFLAWGIDGDLRFSENASDISFASGVTWAAPIQVQPVSALVNGLTSAYAGGSSNTVGLVWLEASGARYQVRFAIV